MKVRTYQVKCEIFPSTHSKRIRRGEQVVGVLVRRGIELGERGREIERVRVGERGRERERERERDRERDRERNRE